MDEDYLKYQMEKCGVETPRCSQCGWEQGELFRKASDFRLVTNGSQWLMVCRKCFKKIRKVRE